MTEQELALKTALETYGKQIDLEISGFDEAKAMRGEKVTITDASKKGDQIIVSASSESITDFSSVTVTRTGKNILDWTKITNLRGETITIDDDKIFISTPDDETLIAGLDLTKALPKLKTAEIVCFNASYVELFEDYCCFELVYEDGVKRRARSLKEEIQTDVKAVYFYFYLGEETYLMAPQLSFYISGLQVEYDDYTEFEAPDIMTATLGADGTTDSLTALSTHTVIFSDTDGVMLDAAYRKSVVYSSEDVISCIPSFEGSLLTAIMKQAEIEIEGIGGPEEAEDMKGAELSVTLSVSAGETTAEKEYDTFIVKDVEYKDETNSVILTCYDLMLRAMTEYAPVVEFPAAEETQEEGDGTEPAAEIPPVTLGSYLQAMCDDLGIPLATPTFPNSDVIIDGEKYDAEYTKRDVLTEIAQAAGGTIAIQRGELYVLYPKETDKKIEPSNLKSIEIGKLYGPVNSIVLARTPQEDNIYKKDEAAEKICEIKIANNKLMDSHREDFIEGIYNALYGLSYYPHDIESFGIGILDICDLFTIETLDGKTYKAIHLSGEVEITQGIIERTKGTAPAATETEYKAASESDRLLKKTALQVNEQENRIEALSSDITEITDEQGRRIGEIEYKVEHTITPEAVNIKITKAISGINSVTTSTGYTFDKDGLRIKKSGEEIENLLDNTGMYVNREDENVLTANAEGVQAVNLSARQFLIVGANSRFEDYEENRTACFYIGG